MQQELERANRLFREVIGQSFTPFWRAPYGERNPDILKWASAMGYQHVAWNIDTLDWVADTTHSLFYSTSDIERRLLQRLERSRQQGNGSIVLMHLGSARHDDPLFRRLPSMIKELRDRGFRLVPVSQLIWATRI